MRARTAAAALLALASLVFPATDGFAADPFVFEPALRWGRFEAHPYARFSEQYNSNLLLKPVSTGTFVHTFDAGFKGSLTLPERHRLEAAYGLNYQSFTKDPALNNALNHGGDLLYKYEGARFTLGLSDAYVNTVDPPNSEQTARFRRWQNSGNASLEYMPGQGPLFAALEANHLAFKYIADDPEIRALLNRYELWTGVRAGYQIAPKSRFYGLYRRGLVHYNAVTVSPTKNHKAHLFGAGLETAPDAKLSGRVEGGLQLRHYDDPPRAGSDRDRRDFVVSAGATYRPLERTRLDLLASRALQEATFQSNPYYVATGGSISLSHRLPSDLLLSATGEVERDDFSDEVTIGGFTGKRRDDLYRARGAVEYPLRDWLTAGVNYFYRVRFSTFSREFDYRAHVSGVTLSATF